MKEKRLIKCSFCGGRGNNPFYRGACPVCKGRGKNEVVVPFITCSECHGSGKKSGTTLTCFECRGIGVLPDMREFIMKAREEVKEIKEEMAQERDELYGKVRKKRLKPKDRSDEFDNFRQTEEVSSGRYFCQSCAKEQSSNSAYRVCEKCFFLYKFGEVREIEPKEEENER